MAFFLPLILDSKKYKSEIVSQIPEMPMAQNKASQPTNDSNVDEGVLVINLDKEPNQASKKNLEKDTPQASEQDNNNQAKVSNQEVEKISDTNNKLSAESKPEAEAKLPAEKPKALKPKELKPKEEGPKVTSAATKPEPKNTVKPKNAATAKTELADVISEGPDFKETAYVIQIGSFSNKDNASKLVTDLRKNDYRAYQRVSKDFARVFVGPYPDKEIAESRSQTLAGIVGNSVKVIEFDPIKH